MPIQNGKHMAKVAELIRQAWGAESEALTTLPETLCPTNLAQAYGIQHAVSERVGATGGWVVWGKDHSSRLACAPIPLAGIHPSPTQLWGRRSAPCRLVPGIGVRVGESLPDYDASFSDERIVATIGSCHAAVGVRQPRIVCDARRDDLTAVADGGGYASLVYSPDGTPWGDAGFLPGRVCTAAAGKEITAQGVEVGRDVIGALHWLAHEGSRWAGGLMVGHLVMVAAETGVAEVPPIASAKVSIDGLGSVELCFSSDATHPAPPSPPIRSPWLSWLKLSMRTSGQ